MSKTVQGRNGAHSKASKRRKKQKNRLIIVVIEILVLLILAAVLFVTVKLSKIQKDTSFNKEDIEVNEGLSSESQEIMAGYTTIALFGLDNRSNGNLSKGNSDVIMIASINNDTHAVKLVSVSCQSTPYPLSFISRIKVSRLVAISLQSRTARAMSCT